MPRYFYTSLAMRPMTLSGKVFKFSIFSVSGGRASGVFATDKPEEIAILEDAVRGRRGVSEMTQEAGEAASKKAQQTPQRPSSTGFKPRVIQPPILPQLAVESVAGVPEGSPRTSLKQSGDIYSGPGGKPSSEAERNRPSIANLMSGRIGKVAPPKTFGDAQAKAAKSAKRADRAKVRIVRPAE